MIVLVFWVLVVLMIDDTLCLHEDSHYGEIDCGSLLHVQAINLLSPSQVESLEFFIPKVVKNFVSLVLQHTSSVKVSRNTCLNLYIPK
jgi:hypothetical protein